MNDFMRQFTRAMEDSGLSIHNGEVVGDGALHRARAVGDRAGSLNIWYVLHLDDKPFGAFGSWKTGQSCTWTASPSGRSAPGRPGNP